MRVAIWQNLLRHVPAALVISLAVAIPSDCAAQRALPRAATHPEVQPATAVQPLPPVEKRSAVFSRQPPSVGSRIQQEVEIEFSLDVIYQQAGQVANQSSTSLARRRTRELLVEKVVDAKIVQAKVYYPQSSVRVSSDGAAEHTTAEPIEDKSYVVEREGETLKITDANGALPSSREFSIVYENMQTIGTPNPLAEFLAGQSIDVGQTVSLPADAAEKFLGLGGQFGAVVKFDLTLVDVGQIDGKPGATFDVLLNVANHQAAPMNVSAQGQLVLETDTCRAIVAQFAGPVRIAEEGQAGDTTFGVTGEGRLKVSMRTRYQQPPR